MIKEVKRLSCFLALEMRSFLDHKEVYSHFKTEILEDLTYLYLLFHSSHFPPLINIINVNGLFVLQGVDSNVETPANFGKYLESFLAFTTHPSQVNIMQVTF